MTTPTEFYHTVEDFAACAMYTSTTTFQPLVVCLGATAVLQTTVAAVSIFANTNTKADDTHH